jgi:hypothetical protein
MLITHNEKMRSRFDGTIIDLETTGEFSRFPYDDSRNYQNLKLTIFGYVNNNELNISCAKGNDGLDQLIERTKKIVPSLKQPLYAFQSRFERGVFYHACGLEIEFDGELNSQTFEKKLNACIELGIPDYGDPYNHDGRQCSLAWERGDYKNAIKHNRNCLLTERDILLKRNYREPDELKFI